MKAVELQGLTKRYGDTLAVSDLSFDIEEGELFALLGVNGAGKTTTMKMLSCLVCPDAGDARILGKSVVQNPAEVKQLIGVLPQETAVAPALTVRENLELMCGAYSFSKEKTRARVASLVELLGLSSVAERRAAKLSGGYARRLSIAMALVSEPKVLFLDEPTLGLDVIARSELWDLIRALRGRVTVILTTHYMEEAEALSDRIGMMRDGKLLICAPPRDILEKTGEETIEGAFLRVVKGDVQ